MGWEFAAANSPPTPTLPHNGGRENKLNSSQNRRCVDTNAAAGEGRGEEEKQRHCPRRHRRLAPPAQPWSRKLTRRTTRTGRGGRGSRRPKVGSCERSHNRPPRV